MVLYFGYKIFTLVCSGSWRNVMHQHCRLHCRSVCRLAACKYRVLYQFKHQLSTRSASRELKTKPRNKTWLIGLDSKRKFNRGEDFSRVFFRPRSGILRQLFGLNCMLFGQSLTKLPRIIRGYIHINTMHGDTRGQSSSETSKHFIKIETVIATHFHH